MKIKKLLVMTFLSLMAATGANAQQPYGGCWHPEDIRNWSPETDPDAKFNRSMVPLAKRFKEPELMKANKNQYYEGQICNATILFPHLFDVSVAGSEQLPRLPAHLLAVHGQACLLGRLGK